MGRSLQLSAQVYFGNCIFYQYLIVFLIMKVALTFCILSLAFLVIFSAESEGEKESLQIVRNKRALSHKADKRKAVNKRKLKKSLKKKNRKPKKNDRTKKQRGNKNKGFNKRRNSRKGKKLRNKGKDSRQSSTCDIVQLGQAFTAYKKAVDYKKKIDRVFKFEKQLKKKSTNLSPFKNNTALLGVATDNGTKCTPKAKNAYEFLGNCSDTIPIYCAPQEINITEAEACTKTSSFALFAKCATERGSDLCQCYKEFDGQFSPTCEAFYDITSEVTIKRKKCLNSTVSGTFSNCMQFIKNEVPMIVEECCAVVDTTTTGSTTTHSTSTTGPTTTGPTTTGPTTTGTTDLELGYPDIKVTNYVCGSSGANWLVDLSVCSDCKGDGLLLGQKATCSRGVCLLDGIAAQVSVEGKTMNCVTYKSDGTTYGGDWFITGDSNGCWVTRLVT